MTGLSGVAVPTRDDRFWIAQDWAQEAKGMVILALVAPPEYIDPGRFGVAAAADAGLKVAVFTSKSDAMEWLLAQQPGDVR